jgi:hypothetical protein
MCIICLFSVPAHCWKSDGHMGRDPQTMYTSPLGVPGSMHMVCLKLVHVCLFEVLWMHMVSDQGFHSRGHFSLCRFVANLCYCCCGKVLYNVFLRKHEAGANGNRKKGKGRSHSTYIILILSLALCVCVRVCARMRECIYAYVVCVSDSMWTAPALNKNDRAISAAQTCIESGSRDSWGKV